MIDSTPIEEISTTPLVLVTGFLGAGKTTFLRALLAELASRNITADVILNDYGNAALDAASLAEHAASLLPLAGSCACCEMPFFAGQTVVKSLLTYATIVCHAMGLFVLEIKLTKKCLPGKLMRKSLATQNGVLLSRLKTSTAAMFARTA